MSRERTVPLVPGRQTWRDAVPVVKITVVIEQADGSTITVTSDKATHPTLGEVWEDEPPIYTGDPRQILQAYPERLDKLVIEFSPLTGPDGKMYEVKLSG